MTAPKAAGAAEILYQFIHPFPDAAVGFPFHQFIGAALVGHMHDDITVEHRVRHLAYHIEIQAEAGIFFQSREIHRHHRDVVVSRPVQRLAQQMNIIGSPAAAARLGNQQPQLVGIVFAAFDGVDQLADDQKRWITGIVVNVFKAFVHNAPVGGGEHIHLVALKLEHLFQHGEMHRKHLRHQQGVLPFHLFREEQAALLVVYQFCHGKTLPFCPLRRGGVSKERGS